MPLPRGKMTDILLKAQSAFSTPATGDYARTFAYSHEMGEQFGLPDDPLLNPPRTNDRDMTAPAPDVHRHAGRMTVPLDLNHIGHWLIGLFGSPSTSSEPATGQIVFSAEPGVGSTITVNGVEFTFVSSSPGAAEIELQGTLGGTLSEIVTVLNGSADTDVDDAAYDEASGTTLTIEHDTAGPGGNTFTLAAGAGSNGTVSGATLAGGCYAHAFMSGGEDLPAHSIEAKLRSTAAGGPRFLRHVGVMVNAITLRMAFASGYHRVDLDLLGRHEEAHTAASQGGTPTTLAQVPVAAVKGILRIADVAQVPILAVDASYRNNLAPLEYVADEEYVSGLEPGESAYSGSVRTRFTDETFYDYGRSSEPLNVEMEWGNDPGHRLVLASPRLRFEKAMIPVTGPGGIEVTLPFKAEQSSGAAMLAATLRNEIASY